MPKFYSLFSSSKGNASFVGSASGGILIDAGVSCRRLMRALDAREIPVDAIQGILITHAHTDHISGLAVFLKKYPIPVYAAADTLKLLLDGGMILESHVRISLSPGRPVHIGDIQVTAFHTMHDIAGSCNYRLTMSDGQSCAVCTDLGCVTQEVLDAVCEADLVLLEANYDPAMLRLGNYPVSLQNRIRGAYGHLSNTDSGALAIKLVESGSTRLILGHLSQNNNTPVLAERTVLEMLEKNEMRQGRDFLLQTASPEGLEQAVIF